MRTTQLEHTFVAEIPMRLQPGHCYVSFQYTTVAHLCPCGCGHEVFTPLSPTDWALTFNGETVSLHPSISNRLCPNRSHYWIRQNRVQWARPLPIGSRRCAGRARRITQRLKRLILRRASQ